MLDTNYNHSPCEFAEQMVSRLYGETSRDEDAQFEAHLQTCFACADELANFGTVRSSLLEWRKEDFFKLKTPTFAIPVADKTSPTISSGAPSWFDALRGLFSSSPVWATAGLAAVLVCAGLILFAFNFSNNSEIAGTNKNSKLIAASPSVEKPIENPKPDDTVEPTEAKATNSQIETTNQKRVAPKAAQVKVQSNQAENKLNNAEPIRVVRDANKQTKKSPSIQNAKAPTLTVAEEEEDTTLRLADLFDEIGTK